MAAGLLAAISARAQGRRTVILVLGDSLSAEYGLARGTGWVALLEKQLARDRIGATVVNASVSGETTSGGRSRLAALLAQHQPTHVVIELGG
ncbi:MAG: GDSL-type esterase/lipase family protein, partial [Acidovorax sp.]